MIDSVSTYLKDLIKRSSFLRFLISGGVNTGVTYVLYLILLRITDYKIAYTAAYILGIALAFLINRTFVFQSDHTWMSLVLFPFVYAAQYVVSIATVWLWVTWLEMPKTLAPMIAIIATIPLTYLLSKFVFGKRPN